MHAINEIVALWAFPGWFRKFTGRFVRFNCDIQTFPRSTATCERGF